MKLVIVSGLSGSGKSVALHTLEDLGYYCIDNLPVQLLEALGQHLLQQPADPHQRVAVGLDARNRPDELAKVAPLLLRLREQGIRHDIVFLEAEPETLIRRFSETRRKHPLTSSERPLEEAIQLERHLLEPLLDNAGLRVDTTHSNVHQLRDLIRKRLAEDPGERLSLLFQSFGFKNSVPRDADFVFDVRCLPNPYWRVELRPLTGLDVEVVRFMEGEPEVMRMRNDLIAFLARWIPRFEVDGRNYLTVAVGCTGGHHRSVYLTERLASHFQNAGQRVMVRHRELP